MSTKSAVPVPTGISTRDILDTWKSGGDAGALVGSPGLGTKQEDIPDADESTASETTEELAARLFGPSGQALPKDTDTSDDSEASEDASPSPTDEDSSATPPAAKQEKPQTPSLVKSVDVVDAKGRKTKVQVDLSNHDAILKSIQKMHAAEHGMRKFQAERDALAKGNEEQTTQAAHFKAISDAYAKNGLAGIVNYIEGDESAYSKVEKSINERYDIRRTASPTELREMEYQEKLERAERAAAEERQANEKFRKDIESQREATEVKQLESLINPAFEKYNFSGKLGNKESEQTVNQMIWNTAMTRLEPLEEQGVDLTSDVIDKVFKEVSSTFRNVVKVQAESKAKASVEAKKQAATESAQTRVMSGQTNTTEQQKVSKMLQNNDVRGLIRNYFSSK